MKFTEEKGRGFQASEDIKRGDQLILENPLLLINADEFAKQFKDNVNVETVLEFEKNLDIPLAVKDIILSLHDNQESKLGFKSVFGVMKSNAQQTGSDSIAIYENISMINHSCVPNVGRKQLKEEDKMIIFAVQDIKKGNELLINQMGEQMTRSEMKQQVLDVFGFNCNCNFCNTPNFESDQRREYLRYLDTQICEVVQKDISETIKLIQEVIDLQKKEGIVSQQYVAKAQLDLLECNLMKPGKNDKFTKSLLTKMYNFYVEMEGVNSSTSLKYKKMISKVPRSGDEFSKIMNE